MIEPLWSKRLFKNWPIPASFSFIFSPLPPNKQFYKKIVKMPIEYPALEFGLSTF